MYTEQLTQALNFGTPIQPQQLTTTTTVQTGSIDLLKCRRAIFTFNQGAFGGTSPTIPVAGLAIGGEADHEPASLNNDTTTYPTANQTSV